jgi:hypothetical protein
MVFGALFYLGNSHRAYLGRIEKVEDFKKVINLFRDC